MESFLDPITGPQMLKSFWAWCMFLTLIFGVVMSVFWSIARMFNPYTPEGNACRSVVSVISTIRAAEKARKEAGNYLKED